ncbi:MAG: PLP-dependent aminotransferase family protein [Gemmatimonadota bacterium]
MRTWQLTVELHTESGLPLFLQIARAIVGDIRRGRLRPGEALPGSRTLARMVGVHRNTVLASYSELVAEGWVRTEIGGGTFVSSELPIRAATAATTLRTPPRALAATTPGFDLAAPIPYDRLPNYPPGMLLLAKGWPDVRLLPTVELARAYRRALVRDGHRLLTYGDSRGYPRLRAALAAMLSTARGISTSADGIMVTRGSQMALDLVARALVSPGDLVVCESLGHPAAWSAFRLAGARLAAIPVDTGGMSIDALAELAGRERIRAVLVTPHHQFPTTTVMPAARRHRLLELARHHRFAIIEDDYDHEFHYDGRPVLPIASGDSAGLVVYVGTLSKILAPGLRAGFAVAPPPVIDRMTSLRVAADLQGDLATEAAITGLFETGELGRHVRRMRGIYLARRDALVEQLRRHLGGAIECEVPSGGMALWARVSAGIEVDQWAGAGLTAGVAFRSGRLYDFADQPQPFTRLGFTYHNEEELGEAVRRMARALDALSRRSGNLVAAVSR